MEETEQCCTVCRKSCAKRCGKCLKVAYCSTDCQKSHWKVHQLECFPVELRIVPETKVRSVILTKDFSAGEVIWKEIPLAYGCCNRRKYEDDDSSDKKPLCLNCCVLIKPEQKVRCQCGQKFCSEACTKSKIHKDECQFFRSRHITCWGHPQRFPADFPLFFRLLNLKEANPAAWEKLMSLDRNYEEFDLTKISPSYPELNVDLINWIETSYDTVSQTIQLAFMRIRGWMDQLLFCGISGWGPKEIDEVRNRMDWNSIEDPSTSTTKWICFYGSSVRHSCAPNVSWSVDKKKVVHFRALTDLKRGDELRMSKEPHFLIKGTSDRRKKLKAWKSFDCTCERCADPAELGSYSGALNCRKLKCQGYLLLKDPLFHESERKCTNCGVVAGHELEQSLVRQNRMNCGLEDGVTGMMKFLEEYEKFLHPNYSDVLIMKESAAEEFANCITYLLQNRELNYSSQGQMTKDGARAAIISAKSILAMENPAFGPWTKRRGKLLAFYFCAAAYLHKYGKKKDWAGIGRMATEEIQGVRNSALEILDFYGADSFQEKQLISMMDEVMETALG